MPAPTRGFGGRVLSVVETTPGTTPTDPAFIKFSDHVQSVRLTLDPQRQAWHDIGDMDPKSFVDGLPVYGLKVSYLLHQTRFTQLEDAIERQADNTLKSQTVEVAVGLDDATSGYFTFKGCKADEVTVKCEVGKPTIVEVTYKALSVSRSTNAPAIGTGSRESSALGDLSRFAVSSILRGGAAVAYITRGAEVRIAHALDVQGTDNQTDPKEAFEGKRTTTGKVDISVDDGGVALADAVMNGTAADMVFNLGAVGAAKLTVTGCVWDNLEIPLDAGQGWVKKDVPFTGKVPSVTTV